jgi:hypothetical protein
MVTKINRMMPLNMTRLLKRLQFRSGQSKNVVYFRPAIYGKDDYGVETGDILVPDINLPDVPAYVRIYQQQDFVLQQGGSNIIGAARVYLPRLEVLKNNPNFDNKNNVYFNQVEGWDKIIDRERNVYTIPVSTTTGWYPVVMNATYTTDSGTTITATVGADTQGFLIHSGTSDAAERKIGMEADRYTFQIKSSGTTRLTKFSLWGGENSNYEVAYTIDGAGLMVPASDWLTVDVPYTSGTVAASSSIWLSGTRYGVAVSTGSKFSYTSGSKYHRWAISSSASGNKVYLRNANMYKSVEWSVRRVDDYNDEYVVLDCVRNRGKIDSVRRAFDDG